MKRLVAALALLMAFSARADEWTRTDTVVEAAGAALHLLDWSQTLHIANNPAVSYARDSAGSVRAASKGFSEANPILGAHPSPTEVNIYFASTLVGHAAIAYLLPRPYRSIWQGMWIGLEGTAVLHNISFHTKFDLPW